jgi:hypothetical protein
MNAVSEGIVSVAAEKLAAEPAVPEKFTEVVPAEVVEYMELNTYPAPLELPPEIPSDDVATHCMPEPVV